jgi:hypothetical protein
VRQLSRLPFVGLISVLFLLGCKADIVETSIKTKHLQDALAGEQVTVSFEAGFSMMSEYDDETKAQINAMERIIENYVSLEEFDITKGDFSLNISIEGEIPLIYSSDGDVPGSVQSPWALVISDNTDGGSLSGYPYKLTVATTSRFSAFEGELQNVNFMISPDEFQPMRIRLKTSGDDVLRIFTGSVEVGGESKVVYETEVSKKITLTMKGGVYERTSQVIYFSI